MYTGQDQGSSNLANEPFDIEEVIEVLEADEKAGVGEEERDVEHCGAVGPYEPFEIRERTKVRNCISCIIAVLWLAGMIWGVDYLVTTGSPLIIILTHIILHGPLANILGFYYRNEGSLTLSIYVRYPFKRPWLGISILSKRSEYGSG